jgi:hypothetical protein
LTGCLDLEPAGLTGRKEIRRKAVGEGRAELDFVMTASVGDNGLGFGKERLTTFLVFEDEESDGSFAGNRLAVRLGYEAGERHEGGYRG